MSKNKIDVIATLLSTGAILGIVLLCVHMFLAYTTPTTTIRCNEMYRNHYECKYCKTELQCRTIIQPDNNGNPNGTEIEEWWYEK